MAIPILLPKQGNTVETCLLLAWKKKKGEHVKLGEILCEVETDKAIFEIDSPGDGVLLDVFYNEGDDIPVLTNIAVVGNPGEDYAEFRPKQPTPVVGEPPHQDSAEGTVKSKSQDKRAQGKTIPSNPGAEPSSEEKGISPRARKFAEQSGVDLERIQGTGPGGRIIERDVTAYAATFEPLSLAAKNLIAGGAARPEEGTGMGNRVVTSDIRKFSETGGNPLSDEEVQVVPLKGVRMLIAERMLASLRNSAQLTLNTSASAVNLLNVRRNFKNNAEYHLFSSVTINDLVHQAVIQVLPRHPALNCLLQDDKMYYFKNIHLGFAVDTPRGLMVPVIKHSQRLSLLELSNEAKRLATQCMSSKVLADELTGGTFTVTNLGGFGIESFTPVLNLPQTAILGVNTIVPRPVDNGNGVEFIPSISFSLTIDHRVVDGATGAKFLQDLTATITNMSLKVTGNTKE
jgi:pyruvate dehydrogenase E2 component (dihydrolipoamide acetyltransferase)